MKLIVHQDEGERITGFSLSGHAGYGEDGSDIVCAAISALSISAANGLEHFMHQPPLTKEDDGVLECTLQAADAQELEQAQWILKTMVLGLEEIQRSYGKKHLKIEYRRWTPC